MNIGSCALGQPGIEWWLPQLVPTFLIDEIPGVQALREVGFKSPLTQESPFIPSSQEMERKSLVDQAEIERDLLAEQVEREKQQLMEKWGTDNLPEAQHIEFWAMDSVGFAKAAVKFYNNLDPAGKANYQHTISTWIRAHTANELYGPFFDKMDIITLGEFGWIFLPEFKTYYWGRHAAWNTNDFIKTISAALPTIEDPDLYAAYKTDTLAALNVWGPPGWKERIPAELKVQFLKSYYPEEIQAAAIATKMAADKAKFIGVAVVGLIAGTLLLSLGRKKSAPATIAARKR